MVGLESVFLHSPNKGFWAWLGDLPPGMPIHPENPLFCSKAAQLSSGRMVSRVTLLKGISIHPTCETMSNTLLPATTFQGYHVGQYQCQHCSDTALAVPALIRELHLHHGTSLAINQWSTSGTKTLFTYSLAHPCHLLHNIILYRHIVLFLLLAYYKVIYMTISSEKCH